MLDLKSWGPATVLIVAAALIVLAVGGVVTVLNPDTLTFKQYLDDIKIFAFAVAGLAGARAAQDGLKRNAEAKTYVADLGAGHPDEEPELVGPAYGDPPAGAATRTPVESHTGLKG